MLNHVGRDHGHHRRPALDARRCSEGPGLPDPAAKTKGLANDRLPCSARCSHPLRDWHQAINPSRRSREQEDRKQRAIPRHGLPNRCNSIRLVLHFRLNQDKPVPFFATSLVLSLSLANSRPDSRCRGHSKIGSACRPLPAAFPAPGGLLGQPFEGWFAGVPRLSALPPRTPARFRACRFSARITGGPQ